MIKNQLYPYIEQYINEFLWGFSKEQIEVGLMDGSIVLDNLNIRPDSTNLKLDVLNIPIWVKAGFIKKIRISCSLMNFIGEKPLEVSIEDVECLICPSLKYINRSDFNYVVEDLNTVKEKYIPALNNFQDIFKKKMIYNEERVDEIVEDDSNSPLLVRITNKLINYVKTFFLKKSYLINVIVKNVHIRFEDDLVNFFGKTIFGVMVDNLELKLSIDGAFKKASFKIDNLSAYHDKQGKTIIPTDYFFNRKYSFDAEYYRFIKKLKFETGQDKQIVLNNFSSKGNIGFKLIGTRNFDFFENKQKKNLKFYLQVATSAINLFFDKTICEKISDLIFFVKNFALVLSIQKFKPKRRPYSKNSIIVSNNKKNPTLLQKRKLVARDWFFYMIWALRWKKLVNTKKTPYKNQMHELLTKHFKSLYSRYYSKSHHNTFIVEPILKDLVDSMEAIEDQKKSEASFENVVLSASSDFLIRSINLNIADKIFFKANDVDSFINYENGTTSFKTEVSLLKLHSVPSNVDSSPINFMNENESNNDSDDATEENVIYSGICKTSRIITEKRPVIHKPESFDLECFSRDSFNIEDQKELKTSNQVSISSYFKNNCIGFCDGETSNSISRSKVTQSNPTKDSNNSTKYRVLQDTLMQELGASKVQLRHNSTKIIKNFNVVDLIHEKQEDHSPDKNTEKRTNSNNLSNIINNFNKDLLKKSKHQKANTQITGDVDSHIILTSKGGVSKNEQSSLVINNTQATQKKFSINIGSLINSVDTIETQDVQERRDVQSKKNSAKNSFVEAKKLGKPKVNLSVKHEILNINPNKSNKKAIVLKAIQQNQDNFSSCKFSFDLGSIDININDESAANLFNSFYFIEMIKRNAFPLDHIEKASDPDELFQMKAVVYNRLDALIQKFQQTKTTDKKQEFSLIKSRTLKNQLESELRELYLVDLNDLHDESYSINKVFSLTKCVYPLNIGFNYEKMVINSFKNNELVSRVSIPDPNFIFEINGDKLYSKLFGTEFHYFKCEYFRCLLNQLYSIFKSQIQAKFEPFVNSILCTQRKSKQQTSSTRDLRDIKGTVTKKLAGTGNKTESNINNLYKGNMIENQLIEVNLNIHNINLNNPNTKDSSITKAVKKDPSKKDFTDLIKENCNFGYEDDDFNFEITEIGNRLKKHFKDDEGDIDFNCKLEDSDSAIEYP